MNYNFKNLVFEGGGVKGIAYIGAMDVLNERNILDNITRVGGTSSGAINATLVGLGFTQGEIKDILWDLNFKDFMDESWDVVRDAERLINHFGWYKGDFFRAWIGELIKQKTGDSESTFADIEVMKETKRFKSLYFLGTNISTSYSEIFSAEHTPKICVADAVRISMSIPLFFSAKRNLQGDVYVDGGVLNNYPIKLFDRLKYLDSNNYSKPQYYESVNAGLADVNRGASEYVYNKETLGFRLDSKADISIFLDHADPPQVKIDSFFDYTWALINTILEAQQNSHLHSDDWLRTVYINTLGIKTTDFSLTNEQKKELMISGNKGALQYFDWFDSDEPKLNKS